MFKVLIKDKKIWVNDKPLFLLSGEVHYWRLAPKSWKDILKKVKELGLNMVATYICWQFHELEPNNYDFTGETNPRRNLKAFLEFLKEMDFWIIIRPGPYIYSEWINFGVPERVVPFHRLHTEFKKEALHWMNAVTNFLKPYFATNGGRIILLQADNEIHPFINFYGEQLGLSNEPGLFQEFLEQRYKNIANLNHLWKTNYSNFSQVRCFDNQSTIDCRKIDLTRFLLWYTKEVANWMTQTYRKFGVDIPIYFNLDTIGVQPWPGLERIGNISAPDYYPTNEFENRTDEHHHFLASMRYVASYSCLPHIAEMESGIWHGWHYMTGALTPNHYRLFCISALLAGASGWNWYMLVNRDNWYMSPINEWGRERPELFPVFKQIVEVFKKLDPTSIARCCDIGIMVDFLQQAVCSKQNDISSGLYAGEELLKSFYETGIDYKLYDLNYSECKKPVLFYGGEKWLSTGLQQKLLNYIQEGGHLVIIGNPPVFDDNFQESNLLNLPSPEGIIGYELNPQKILLNLGLKECLIQSPYIIYFSDAPGTPIIGKCYNASSWFTNLPEGKEYIIGYSQIIGRGKLTFIGLKSTPQLILALLQELNIKIYCSTNEEGIHSALLKRDNAYYLIAVNNNNITMGVKFKFPEKILPQGPCIITDFVSDKKEDINLSQQNWIYWHIEKKDGIVLEIHSEGDR